MDNDNSSTNCQLLLRELGLHQETKQHQPATSSSSCDTTASLEDMMEDCTSPMPRLSIRCPCSPLRLPRVADHQDPGLHESVQRCLFVSSSTSNNSGPHPQALQDSRTLRPQLQLPAPALQLCREEDPCGAWSSTPSSPEDAAAPGSSSAQQLAPGTTTTAGAGMQEWLSHMEAGLGDRSARARALRLLPTGAAPDETCGTNAVLPPAPTALPPPAFVLLGLLH